MLTAAGSHSSCTYCEELSPQGLGLLPDCLTCVKHAHDGSHALGTANGGQASHTTTNDQHLGRGHLACSCDLAGEEAAKVVGSLNHGPVEANSTQQHKRLSVSTAAAQKLLPQPLLHPNKPAC
jgi:hypothetical protein